MLSLLSGIPSESIFLGEINIMKEVISIIAAAALVSCSSAVLFANAAEQDTKVLVTISDGKGSAPVLVQKEVNVTDIDSDGKLTINDALYIAHEENFTGGAASGFKSSEKAGYTGPSIDKLWGIENGGSYGFYVDNNASMSLSDEVKDGNSIYAFVYSDTAGYSDSYSWFDKNTADAKQGDEIELTLSHIKYDANRTPLSVPVEGAVITVNGKATEFKTDANGKVKVKLDEAGEDILISASSDSVILVPPVLVADVAANSEVTTTAAETTAAETTSVTTAETTAAETTTEAPAATTAYSPMVTPGQMVTFIPIQAFFLTVTLP